MKKIVSSPTRKVVNINKIRPKNKIIAGLINLDTLLLQIRITTRVEGNYVNFKFYLTKDGSLFNFKIKLVTFLRLHRVFEKTYKDITKN